MGCREVKRQIAEEQEGNSRWAFDESMMNHLRNCPDCLGQLRASQTVRLALTAGRENPTGETTPLAVLRTRIEAQRSRKPLAVNLANNKEIKNSFEGIANMASYWKNRPRLGAGIAVAAVALAFFTLVPFKYDRTVGYEVAFAGVDKNLALDSDRLNEMLEKLGLHEATVDVTDCEATCNVKFSELKSADDARLLMTVFEGSDKIRVLEDIKPQVIEVAGNLLGKIHSRVFFADGEMNSTVEELHQVVIDCLGENYDCNSMIWVSKIVDGEGTVTVDCDVRLVGEGLTEDMQAIITSFGDSCSFTLEGDGPHLMKKMIFFNGEGDFHGDLHEDLSEDIALLELKDGDFSDEDLAELADKGFTVSIEEGPNGERIIKLSKKVTSVSDGVADDRSDLDEDGLAKDVTALPEGYELSQNYPNPFNPMTKINFTVPISEQVTLDIINVMGQRVRTLIDETVSSGTHTVEWDSRSDDGQRVSSGIYFYRLKVGNRMETRKMTLLK